MAYNFDDLKTDAKNLLDKAASKANEAVDYSKTQLDRAQLRSKIREKYTELGRLCYNMHETDADETGRMKIVINDIRSLEHKLKYKKNLESDVEEISAELKACADEISRLDSKMQQIHRKIDSASSTENEK